MRIRGMLCDENRIVHDEVKELGARLSEDGLAQYLSEFCSSYNLSRPVVLNKHVRELNNFSRTQFRADDFMDDFNYYMLVIEVIHDDKK